jgi:hypothetical protein
MVECRTENPEVLVQFQLEVSSLFSSNV